MRRAWLRGPENVHKRYLIDVAGFNLGILMRALFGCGTPREAASALSTLLFVIQTEGMMAIEQLSFAAAALRSVPQRCRGQAIHSVTMRTDNVQHAPIHSRLIETGSAVHFRPSPR
jgi:hypothetical protein